MSKRRRKAARLARNQIKRRIAPGLWEDMEGKMHWALPELLAMVGLPNTPENLRIAREQVGDLLREHGASIIIHREKPD